MDVPTNCYRDADRLDVSFFDQQIAYDLTQFLNKQTHEINIRIPTVRNLPLNRFLANICTVWRSRTSFPTRAFQVFKKKISILLDYISCRQ